MGKRKERIKIGRIGQEMINIGYAGENEHTQVIIGCTEVYTDYPNATAEMIVKSPSGLTYQAVIQAENGTVIWDIRASDVASSGMGQYQLIFTDGETEVLRSAIGTFTVMKSIDEPEGESPTPQETWAEAMASVLQEQISAAAEDVALVLEVNCGTVTTLPVTIVAAGVTAQHKAFHVEAGTPSVLTSALTVTTGDGTITLSGTKGSGSTTIKVTLIKAVAVEGTVAAE